MVCRISPAIDAKMTEIGFAPMSVGKLIYGLLTYQVYYTEHLWFLYVLFLLFLIGVFEDKYGATRYALGIWRLPSFASLFIRLPGSVL